MSFSAGNILFFKEYQFTDTKDIKPHYALVLLPEEATQYQGSVYCCVITSKESKHWSLLLEKERYQCFRCDSYACFDRKDLVSKTGLDKENQPLGSLVDADIKKAYKILKKSLFVINDMASDPFMRGAIIYHWKKLINQ